MKVVFLIIFLILNYGCAISSKNAKRKKIEGQIVQIYKNNYVDLTVAIYSKVTLMTGDTIPFGSFITDLEGKFSEKIKPPNGLNVIMVKIEALKNIHIDTTIHISSNQKIIGYNFLCLEEKIPYQFIEFGKINLIKINCSSEESFGTTQN